MYDMSVLRELRKRDALTLDDVHRRSGISPAVLSRIERNKAVPELDTLYRIARVFGMTATDLLAIAEQRTAHTTSEESYRHSGFTFRKVTYGNLTVFHVQAAKGARLSNPEIHHNEYELCWVLQGAIHLQLPAENQPLQAGQAIQFDAVLPHAYSVDADCNLMIIHVRKGMRF